MNLLSDAAQSETWPAIKPQLTKGKVCKRDSMLLLLDRPQNIITDNFPLPDSLLLPRFLPRLQGPDQGRGSH